MIKSCACAAFTGSMKAKLRCVHQCGPTCSQSGAAEPGTLLGLVPLCLQSLGSSFIIVALLNGTRKTQVDRRPGRGHTGLIVLLSFSKS